MIALTVFNNKGGVGKTTFACNMAAYFAHDLDKRVLLVDTDPQCNATQLVLSEEQWEAIYLANDSSEKTLLRAFRHMQAGDSYLETDLDVHHSARFKIDVLAGHPRVSVIEDVLSSSWSDFRSGGLGGARRSSWAANLVRAMSSYDVVVFDCSPSLGALNRSVMIGSTHFVTPMAADLFSLYALDNIGEWMTRWLTEFARAYSQTASEAPNLKLADFGVPEGPMVSRGYAGYTVQQYVARASGGKLRAVAAYDRYRNQIPSHTDVLAGYRASSATSLDMGVVPNMFSMVPTAQNAHAPIFDLTPADGIRGAQFSQQDKYANQLRQIGAKLSINVGLI